MREQPKRDWSPAAKKEWSTPKLREIPLTDELLARFKLSDSTLLTDEQPAKKAASGR
jgi:hypothetical protein